MKYLAVLGRQPKISLAELEALFQNVQPLGAELAEFEADELDGRNCDALGAGIAGDFPDIRRLGGTQKIAAKIEGSFQDFAEKLPQKSKITIGVSDYTRGATAFKAQGEALKLKRLLVKSGRSVRVVPNKTAALSSAVSFHNHLFRENKIELIKIGKTYYRVIGVQNIDDYVRRDRERPARDAKVGMLPPKLAQILINLCGNLPEGSRLLDPFCGTGVVLQEAALMGYVPYGTDVSERMVEYTRKNLEWLVGKQRIGDATADPLRAAQAKSLWSAVASPIHWYRPAPGWSTANCCSQGDAMSFQWQALIDAVACETYLGQPMSTPPTDIKLKEQEQECGTIIRGFLKNLAAQIQPGTPVVIAVPAWLRLDGQYQRLNLLDEIDNLGYNVMSFKNLEQNDLLYHRERQVVAREIIVLRKK